MMLGVFLSSHLEEVHLVKKSCLEKIINPKYLLSSPRKRTKGRYLRRKLLQMEIWMNKRNQII
uniref:Uncharacterized protein n=1 Tax=Rhizophora mucronata TaxID=61149 RepID=A0A2P2J221_RHIMU